MPRTKVTKNSKRNREVASREEKVRTYEMKMDGYAEKIEEIGSTACSQVDTMVSLIISATNTKLLHMKMSEFFQLQLHKISDYKASDESVLYGLGSQSICNTTMLSASKEIVNRNDEGYLTEDSSASGSASALTAYTSIASSGRSTTTINSLHTSRAMRTPGPLQSARARRGRRSRSACGEINAPGSAKPKATLACNDSRSDRSSRSKMRTPIASRSKALSADRTPAKLKRSSREASPCTPPLAFLRWPKPGEVALSKCGSPIVSQVFPDRFANVNIPIRNGVLSLRPKKISELKPDIIEAIDMETLHQIKTLHANLNMIVNMADKVGLK